MSFTVIGRDLSSRALHETALPVPYDAAAMPGASLLGTDGRVYRSERFPTGADPYQWVSAYDVARTVSSNVSLGVIEDDTIMTVDPSLSEVEGVRYQSLGEALSYLSRFQPVYRADWAEEGSRPLRVRIELASGFQMAEQIQFFGIDLGWVGIHAIDPVVPVIASSLTRFTSGPAASIGAHAMMQAANGSVLPGILGFKFQCDTSTVPVDPSVGLPYTPRAYGIILGRAVGSTNFTTVRADGVTPLPGGARASGIDNFVRNIFVRAGGDFTGTGFTANNAQDYGVFVEAGGKATLTYCMINGAGINSVRVQGGQIITGGQFTGSPDNIIADHYDQDFRKTVGVDSSTDLLVASGGFLTISNISARGEYNLPAWSSLPAGFISDVRKPILPRVRGMLEPQPYTVATLPSASANTGVMILVTDGNAGSPCFAQSDGTNWLRIAPGAAVSAT